MKTSSYARIQWFHEELCRRSYPNAVTLSERFHISVRQAQRDITYLREKLSAPLLYDHARQGYQYSAPYTLPVAILTENSESRSHVREDSLYDQSEDTEMPDADNIIIQSQIPYTALLRIQDRLTVLEMRSYILSREQPDVYLCEFHNVDRFLCAIMTARSDIRILDPDWLRARLLHMAERVVANNRQTEPPGHE